MQCPGLLLQVSVNSQVNLPTNKHLLLFYFSKANLIYLSLYREFDESLLRRILEISYEDDVVDLPPALDVSSYMMSEVFEINNIHFYH